MFYKYRVFVFICFYLFVAVYAWGGDSIQFDDFVIKENKIIFFKDQPFRIQSLTFQSIKENNGLFKSHWSLKQEPIIDLHSFSWTLGQGHNYLVLNFEDKSIWQFDSNFQRLSWFPLPQAILDLAWTQAKIFWIDPYFIYFIFLSQKKVVRYLQISQRFLSSRVFELPHIYKDVFLFYDEERKPYFSFLTKSKIHNYNISFIFQHKNFESKYATSNLKWKIRKKINSVLSLTIGKYSFCIYKNVFFSCP